MDYETFCFNLMDTEPAIQAVAIMDRQGKLLYQTENWDVSQDIGTLHTIVEEAQKPNGVSPGRLEIMKLGYMIIEFIPERIIGTNAGKKGHVILGTDRKGTLVCFIDPAKSPRDVLFNVQSYARKLE